MNTEAENNLVSIIIPVYNVEKYLPKCIGSIEAQTFGNYEVLLVDDGSTDRSGILCDEYAERDSRVRVIHQENSGQAAARNHAVKQAAGEYIVFIDSDDYVDPDYIEYLLNLLHKYDADVSIGGSAYLYEGKEPKSRKGTENDFATDAEQALIRINYNEGSGAMVWAKLYKKKLIEDHPFPEGKIYEDLATTYKIIGDCKTVAMGNRRIYYWLQRTGSTTRESFDERQMDAVEAVEGLLQYTERNFPGAMASARYRYTAKAIELIAVCFNSGGNRDVFYRLKKMADRFANAVLRDKRAKKTLKARIVAVKGGYRSARIAFRTYEKLKRSLL